MPRKACFKKERVNSKPNITLYLGDCIEVMKTMSNKSIDLVLIDPPYFLPYKHYATRKNFRRSFSDLGILETFFRMVYEEMERVLKPDGRFYIFCDGQSYPLFYYYCYFFTKSERPLIWDKKTSINGYSWRHQHELILFGEMPEAEKVPTGDGDILRHSAVKVNNRKHPAEKPLELVKDLVAKSSDKNDTVLDMFMGSGTTLVAAKELGRNAIGIETEPRYYEIAKRRIKDAQKSILHLLNFDFIFKLL